MLDYPNPMFDDIQGPSGTAASGAAVWTVEQIGAATGVLIPWIIYDQADEASWIFQMPHRKVLGSSVHFHLHYTPEATPSGTKNVRFTYYYTFVKVGDAIPAIGSWTTGTIDIPVVAADVGKHLMADVLDINAPSGETYSAILMVKLVHVVGGANTYTESKPNNNAKANFGILYADCHFESKKLGSRLELTD